MPLTDDQLASIDRIKESSEDSFDKNALYIAAGSLALSMTFIGKMLT